MMEGGRMPFIPPNYGLANAVGASGAALGGMFKNINANQAQFSDGGGGGGLFSTIYDDERFRRNQGSYT